MDLKLSAPYFSIGWIIALLVLIAAFILWLMGMVDAPYATLFAACAASRLL